MLGFMPVTAWWARQGLNLRPHPCEGSQVMEMRGFPSESAGTESDSSENISAFSDQNLAIPFVWNPVSDFKFDFATAVNAEVYAALKDYFDNGFLFGSTYSESSLVGEWSEDIHICWSLADPMDDFQYRPIIGILRELLNNTGPELLPMLERLRGQIDVLIDECRP